MSSATLGYIFAIISSLFFSLYVVPKKITNDNPMYYTVFMALGFFIISVLMYIMSTMSGLNKEPLFSPILLILILRGFLWVIGSNFFLTAIDKIGISRATQYKNLQGPIGVFLTLTVLSEFMVTNVSFVLLAAILTFLSAILFTIKKSPDNTIDKTGIIYALISACFFGISALIQKWVTNNGFIYMQNCILPSRYL